MEGHRTGPVCIESTDDRAVRLSIDSKGRAVQLPNVTIRDTGLRNDVVTGSQRAVNCNSRIVSDDLTVNRSLRRISLCQSEASARHRQTSFSLQIVDDQVGPHSAFKQHGNITLLIAGDMQVLRIVIGNINIAGPTLFSDRVIARSNSAKLHNAILIGGTTEDLAAIRIPNHKFRALYRLSIG